MENPKRILVVDDSEFDRDLMMKALHQRGGFATLGAGSGEECLKIIADSPVDLILMDLVFPHGEVGSDILQKIRAKHNQIELPVIVVTGLTQTSPLIACLKFGANDYIRKPMNFDVAIARIRTHLQLAEQSRQMAKLTEIAALSALIATYNHEINNPLAIVTLCMSERNWNKPGNREQLETAVSRITDILVKIRDVADRQEFEYKQYVGLTQMLNLEKKSS